MKKSKTNIVGHGENGQTHTATGKDISVYASEDEKDMELDAPNGCDVTHQEHKLIEIPAGRYNVGGILEYDPAAEEARQVRD